MRRTRFQPGTVTGFTDTGRLTTTAYIFDTLDNWSVVRTYRNAGPLRIRSHRCTLLITVKVRPEIRAHREARRLNKEWRAEMGLK